MPKHLLVLVDNLEYAHVALEKAQQLALSLQLPVRILAFTHQSLDNLPFELSEQKKAEIKKTLIDKYHTELSGQLESLFDENQISLSVHWHKHPEEFIKENHALDDVEMLIKARHIDNQNQFTLLDWRLIRTFDTPLYFVADNTWKNKKGIFACLDLGSKLQEKYILNQKIMELGNQLAAKLSVPLHIGYAISVSPILRDLGIVFTDEQEINALKNLPEQQQALVEQYQLADKLKIKAGDVAKVIPSLAADANASLVVMGSIGRTGLKGKLIGNTAEQVMKLLKTDLLVLSPSKQK